MPLSRVSTHFLDLLTHAPQMPRNLKTSSQYHNDTTPCGAIELGHDQTRYLHEFTENAHLLHCILSGRCIEHQQH